MEGGCGLCGSNVDTPVRRRDVVGVAQLEVVNFCLSSFVSPSSADLFLEEEEDPSSLICGECVSLIGEVNRLHDVLTELTAQLKETLLKILQRRKRDDLTGQRRNESKGTSLVGEVIQPKFRVKEEVVDTYCLRSVHSQ